MRKRAKAKNYAAWFAARVKHGAYVGGKESSEHGIWREMKRRCTSQDVKHRRYRGVKVCRRWQKFENFITDMGPRPSSQHSLDRYPNHKGDYKPSNCRWATRKQQASNTKSNLFLTDGISAGTLSEWASQLRISVALASYRWHCRGTLVENKKFKYRRGPSGPWRTVSIKLRRTKHRFRA